MALIKTITTPSGSRPLGWVVTSSNSGNVLVVRRTPKAIAVTTRKSQYVSINESAEREEAGWALDDVLYRAIKTYDCKRVIVYVPKPGILYTTEAGNYSKAGVVYMVPKSKSGGRVRCVGMQHFTREKYRVKV